MEAMTHEYDGGQCWCGPNCMPPKPILLDLYCCAGGASRGYDHAGFDVIGVDYKPMRNYPYPFHHGDAVTVLSNLLRGRAIQFRNPDGTIREITLAMISVIVASPPCQAFSITKHSHDREHPNLLPSTRWLLTKTGLPYVIENVEGAPLRDAMLLCGSMFGLKADDVDGRLLALRRHRLFESNVFLMGAGGCAHDSTTVGGSYGGGRHRRAEDRDKKRRGGYTPDVKVRAALLGIDWPMTQYQLAQAIPPAYTEFIGRQLMAAIKEGIPR